ncbi:SAM-dependent methyltransferase [Occallatibacter savannae]|uniref:SAM-dependent methyltransferase n=1 Tax=Occallatibacter savannae TaxID=1002691 RepID=UPI000D69BD70|nr:class I SAM-dependent methyltransferase [Occallatibacter savannae]
MSLKPFLDLQRDGRLAPLLSIGAALKPYYKLAFLAAAGESGLLALLADGPMTFDAIAAHVGAEGQGREALEAWLQLGVRLKLMGRDGRGYTLRGMAAALAEPKNDAALAMVQEVAELHHKLIAETVPRVREKRLFTLADQDGELIARSSRILEAFQVEAIQRTFPKQGPVRLLEIGCGSGVYLKHAAEVNPALTAVGVELQPAVAEAARTNLSNWGLEGRVTVEAGDIRAKTPSELFDIATLYNDLYYFPVDERVALLKHLAGFLKTGGFLLLTTCCQGGSVGSEALNLWGAATADCGRLPAEDELAGQLREAGFRTVKTRNLLPGDRFVAFQAFRA